MNTFILKDTIRAAAVALGLVALGATAQAQAEKPLLDYRFDKGSGLAVDDRGTARLNLTAGSSMSWGTAGTGVAGGHTLGRVGDRDVFIENRKADGRGLDGLQAFTVCAWYKARFLERSNGVLFELISSDGLGYRLQLASRNNPAGAIEFALISALSPREVTPNAKGGVQYSPWENPLAVEDEWVFIAAATDLRDDTRAVTFYAGSATKAPEVILGSFARPASWTDIRVLGKISTVRLGNSADMSQPVPVGFYFDDLTFFGSDKETGGVLMPSEIRAVWERTLGKKAGAR